MVIATLLGSGAMLALTAPAAEAASSIGYMTVFQAANHNLKTVNADGVTTDTAAAMRSSSTPSVAAPAAHGDVVTAFVGPDGFLWKQEMQTSVAGRIGAGLCVAPGTSPAIAVDPASGSWKIAYHGCGDHLWTVDSANTAIDTGGAMAPGTSPSIAWLPFSNGYEITFVHSDGLLYRDFPDTNWFPIGNGLCVAPGTSPAIATDGNNGWKIAYHGCGDHLWTVDGAPAIDTGGAMAPGTSPSIAWLPFSNGYEITFVHSDGLLYRDFPDTNWFPIGNGLCVAPGTSPAIATDGNNGWKIAYHGCGDHLWTVDGAGAVDTGETIASGSNPSIALVTGDTAVFTQQSKDSGALPTVIHCSQQRSTPTAVDGVVVGDAVTDCDHLVAEMQILVELFLNGVAVGTFGHDTDFGTDIVHADAQATCVPGFWAVYAQTFIQSPPDYIPTEALLYPSDLHPTWIGPSDCLPVIVSMSDSDARAKISQLGLRVGTVTHRQSDASVDSVISWSLEADGVTVDLVESDGNAVVPNVMSRTEADARALIEGAGLVVGTVSHPNDCVSPGDVEAQHPAGGTRTTRGTSVGLIVSAGNGCGPIK